MSTGGVGGWGGGSKLVSSSLYLFMGFSVFVFYRAIPLTLHLERAASEVQACHKSLLSRAAVSMG